MGVMEQTVETVKNLPGASLAQLKLGVNEMSARGADLLVEGGLMLS